MYNVCYNIVKYNITFLCDTAFSIFFILASGQIDLIRQGIQFWIDNTCLDFVEGIPDDGEYIYVQAENSG